MITQKLLYKYNRQRVNDTLHHDERFINYEKEWINDSLLATKNKSQISTHSELIEFFGQLINNDSSIESYNSNYVSSQISLNEFKVMLQEFSLDGLTEAQVFYYIMPRLNLQAQMPMLRILIDEFGSANPKKMHTTLFTNLLQELAMPIEQEYYIDRIDGISYEFINIYYWMTLRADDPSYFVGALTYMETIIPIIFPCLVEACQRLGIHAHHYYSEHCHIDDFHSLECKKILLAMEKSNTLDPHKAWLGMQLSRFFTHRIFDNAVNIAREFSTNTENTHLLPQITNTAKQESYV